MNKDLIQKLQYTQAGQEEAHSLPLPLIESIQLISDFFSNNSNHKLCLVFPTKEFAAQWLSIPTVLFLIESDFAQFKNEIVESLEKAYDKGQSRSQQAIDFAKNYDADTVFETHWKPTLKQILKGQ